MLIYNVKMLKSVFPFVIAAVLLGCSEMQNEQNPQEIYFANKSKWQKSISEINEYKITTYQSGMLGYYQSVVIFETNGNTVLSCELTEKLWDELSPTVSDCLSQTQYHNNVDDYFETLSDMIAKSDLAQYKFNEYGVPIFALGSIEPTLADASMSGFEISFEVIK